jgi:protein O-GlcNAc transferase
MDRQAAVLVREGMALHETGDLQGAEGLYRQALVIAPNNVEALYLHAQAARDRKAPREAVELLQQAVALQPRAGVLLAALGHARLECGDAAGALRDYRAALDLQADLTEARAGLAAALQQKGELASAVNAYRDVLRDLPECAELHYNAAVALDELRRFDESVLHFRQAVAAKPDYGAAWLRLGDLCKRMEHINEAAQAYQSATELPEVASDAYVSLGALLRESGHRDTALKCLQQAVELTPDSPVALCGLGMCHRGKGRLGRAIECFEQAHALDREDPRIVANLFNALQDACRWAELERLNPHVERMIDDALDAGTAMPISPFMTLSTPMTAARQQAVARHFAEREVTGALLRTAFPPRAAAFRKRIRIGYVSPNFRNHPTSHLMVRLFELHDHERFEVFVYSQGKKDGSDYRRRIEQACDHFIDVSTATTAQTAERIAGDGIDILVDRAGYTSNARPEVFALRPAPIQVNYIGFPGTLGADYIDYVLTDCVVTPPGAERWLTEQPVYLPGSYLVTDPDPTVAVRTPGRRECGLPQCGFVFCCFNNSFKIEPTMFAIWMRLLQAVPDSVLWLLRSSDAAVASLLDAAGKAGVAPERLVFAERAPKDMHLARHVHADLFLDTRYYNAHTTAVDALIMGVPMVTCPGETFASRVGASVAAAAGQAQLIAPDLGAYERIALALATDPERLAQAKAGLRDVRERPLFDAVAYARHLENAYSRMWDLHRTGQPPGPIRVEPRWPTVADS